MGGQLKKSVQGGSSTSLTFILMVLDRLPARVSLLQQVSFQRGMESLPEGKDGKGTLRQKGKQKEGLLSG